MSTGSKSKTRRTSASASAIALAERTAKFGSWDWGVSSESLNWSEGSYLLFEYPVGVTLTYEMWRVRVDPFDIERVERAIQDALEQGTDYDVEYDLVLPSGTRRRINARGEVVERRNGRAVRMAGVNYDITDREATEQALHLQSERVELALDSGTIVGTWVWDVAGDRFTADERFARSFSLDPDLCREGILLKDVLRSIHPEDVPKVERAVNAALKKGGPYRCEYRVAQSDGGYCWVEASGRCELDENGAPVRFPGILVNITEHKHAEEVLLRKDAELQRSYEEQTRATNQLREASALLRAISDHIGLAIFAKDRAGRATFANPVTLALIGKPSDMVIGHTDEEFFQEKEVARKIVETDQRIMNTGVAEQLEEFMPMPDGTPRIWISNKVPYRDEDGNVIGLLGVSRDITERKRAEETLRASEHRYHALFENMVEGFFLAEIICDPEGEPVDYRYLDMNPAFEPMTGLKREDVIGRTVREILPEIGEQWIKAYGRVALTGEPLTLCDYAEPLGRYYDTVAYSPQPRQFACVFSDVTERRKAEDALRQSEERHRILAETMLHGIVHQRADGTIIDMNPAAERILGKTKTEFLGSDSLKEAETTIMEDGSQFPGAEHPAMVALRTGKPVRGVLMGIFNPKANERRWIDIDAVPVFHAGETKPSEVYTVFADVTDRKRAEQTLRRTEQRLRFHMENTPLAVIEWGADFRLSRWSGEAERIFGWRADEVLGKRLDEFRWVYDEDFDKVAEVSRGLQFGNCPRSVSVNRNYRKDGSVVYCEWYNSSMVNDSGKLVSIFSLVLDVTERRCAEEALRQSEQQFRDLADAMPQIVWTADPEGSVTYFNRKFDEFVGAADVTGHDRWLSILHPDDRRRCLDLWQHCVRTGEQYQIEYRFKFNNSNEYRWHLGRAIPIRGPDGRIVRWYGTCTDIHDFKTAQAALVQSEKLASVGRMAATVAHEVNNPLAAVTNLVYLAQNDRDCPPRLRSYLEAASMELKRVSHVTRQVLGFYKESAGAEMVSLPAIVDEALELFSSRTAARNIRLVKQHRTPTKIKAVGGEVRQVIGNLIANSLDAVPEGGTIKVRVSNFMLGKGKAGLRVTVADNGSGIEKSAMPNIFEPLFTTKQSVGTGLGLWICKQLVEKHGGWIRCRSNTKGTRRGTTFSVCLPAKMEEAALPAKLAAS